MRDLADAFLESQRVADEHFVGVFNEAMRAFNEAVTAALAERQIAAVAVIGAHEAEVFRRVRAFNGEPVLPDAGNFRLGSVAAPDAVGEYLMEAPANQGA